MGTADQREPCAIFATLKIGRPALRAVLRVCLELTRRYPILTHGPGTDDAFGRDPPVRVVSRVDLVDEPARIRACLGEQRLGHRPRLGDLLSLLAPARLARSSKHSRSMPERDAVYEDHRDPESMTASIGRSGSASTYGRRHHAPAVGQHSKNRPDESRRPRRWSTVTTPRLAAARPGARADREGRDDTGNRRRIVRRMDAPDRPAWVADPGFAEAGALARRRPSMPTRRERPRARSNGG